MKVILLQDVENLGKKYDIKEVKSGYARNFLFPQKIARAATKQALKWLAGQKEIIEKEAEEDLKKAQEMASNLDGLELNIPVKVGEDGQLFESINSQKIAEKLKEMNFEVKKSQICLEKPIKELGEFPIKINLDHNLETEITILIVEEK
ncbi:MAG: large subunit ribosomal protein L9 [Parcubacteria group bacterium Licking1014_1]|nr:MAG: large subunit ribosomal protein L9 [Parcubacteria group bacterium Licking1014_1]